MSALASPSRLSSANLPDQAPASIPASTAPSVPPPPTQPFRRLSVFAPTRSHSSRQEARRRFVSGRPLPGGESSRKEIAAAAAAAAADQDETKPGEGDQEGEGEGEGETDHARVHHTQHTRDDEGYLPFYDSHPNPGTNDDKDKDIENEKDDHRDSRSTSGTVSPALDDFHSSSPAPATPFPEISSPSPSPRTTTTTMRRAKSKPRPPTTFSLSSRRRRNRVGGGGAGGEEEEGLSGLSLSSFTSLQDGGGKERTDPMLPVLSSLRAALEAGLPPPSSHHHHHHHPPPPFPHPGRPSPSPTYPSSSSLPFSPATPNTAARRTHATMLQDHHRPYDLIIQSPSDHHTKAATTTSSPPTYLHGPGHPRRHHHHHHLWGISRTGGDEAEAWGHVLTRSDIGSAPWRHYPSKGSGTQHQSRTHARKNLGGGGGGGGGGGNGRGLGSRSGLVVVDGSPTTESSHGIDRRTSTTPSRGGSSGMGMGMGMGMRGRDGARGTTTTTTTAMTTMTTTTTTTSVLSTREKEDGAKGDGPPLPSVGRRPRSLSAAFQVREKSRQ